MYKTNLFLLGAHICVVCERRATRDALVEYFDGAIADKVSSYSATPDYIVRIADPEFFRELIRGRPANFGPLRGVSVTPRGEPTLEEWHHLAPPLPPTSVGVLGNRFVGLHAATVMSDAGSCCVLVGVRGAGKSTLSVHLAVQFGHTLLSDEETIVHGRSLFVEPFPRAVHVGISPTEKVLKSYGAAGLRRPTHGGTIHTVVLLKRVEAGPVRLRRASPESGLLELLQHQRAWGSRPLDSYATMARIAAHARVFHCEWSEFAQLPALAADIDGILRNQCTAETA